MSRIWIKSSIRNSFPHIVLPSLKSLSVKLGLWSAIPCVNQHKINPRRRAQFLIRIKVGCNPLFGYFILDCLFLKILTKSLLVISPLEVHCSSLNLPVSFICPKVHSSRSLYKRNPPFEVRKFLCRFIVSGSLSLNLT